MGRANTLDGRGTSVRHYVNSELQLWARNAATFVAATVEDSSSAVARG